MVHCGMEMSRKYFLPLPCLVLGEELFQVMKGADVYREI
jgi:hypothetical protein